MKSQVAQASSRPPVSVTSRLGQSLPAEAEAEVARFGQHIRERQIASEREAPYWLNWVRGFLAGPAKAGSAEDALLHHVASLTKSGLLDWQVAQAERSVRYFLGSWREGPPARPRA